MTSYQPPNNPTLSSGSILYQTWQVTIWQADKIRVLEPISIFNSSVTYCFHPPPPRIHLHPEVIWSLPLTFLDSMSLSWMRTAYTGWQSCYWVTCTGLSPHLPLCLTPFLPECNKGFKRWDWKWIFLRIRNKSQQGTNNIKILQTVRNWSNSSCCDVHNGHSMWTAIKNWKEKGCLWETTFKNHRERKCLMSRALNCHRKTSGVEIVNPWKKFRVWILK